jgi:hypothetical protein
MKSTQAMRDRARELMSKERDDYDRAFECVLDDLEGLLRVAPGAQAGPAYHRLSISQLALAFGVSDDKAFEAVGMLGDLHRESAAPPARSTATSDGLNHLETLFSEVVDRWVADDQSPQAISSLQFALGAVRDEMHRAAPTPSDARDAEPVHLFELPELKYAAFIEAIGGNKPPTQALIDLIRGHDANQKRVEDARSDAMTVEPVAWICELAYAISSDAREYSDWRQYLSTVKPCVPVRSIRNLRALYATRPAPAPDAVEALRPFADYQLRMVAFAASVKPADLHGYQWVACFDGPMQPEFRHFAAAKAALLVSRNERGGSDV